MRSTPHSRRLVWLALFPGLLALVVEPAIWLYGTWAHEGYDNGAGPFVALLCAAIAAWSVRSGPATSEATEGIGLLLAAAAVRLLGRVLDIDHIGALALSLDVVAVGRILRLDQRPWAVSPWFLGGLFALSLPVEKVVQHFAAWPLRTSAAVAADAILSPFLDVQRQGTLLVGPELELFVDLPCSGAQGITLLSVFAFAVAARRVARPHHLFFGLGAVLGGAFVANTVRIVVLYAVPSLLPEPWHSGVGLVGLAVGMVPSLVLANLMVDRLPTVGGAGWTPSPVIAGVFSIVAVGIAVAPQHPVDVSRPFYDDPLPASLSGWPGDRVELAAKEQAYLEAYGGRVDKRVYELDDGSLHTAVVVRSSQPVRHLHGPRHCLRGAGHTVERVALVPGDLPTSVWRTTDPDGNQWRVLTTLVSDRGQTADTVSEVVWRWAADPDATWMLVERISPWQACEADPVACEHFDDALFTALLSEPLES